jgi:hypothetical protein
MGLPNLANLDFLGEVTITSAIISGVGEVFSIFGTDPSSPLLTVDTTTNAVNIFSDLNVFGQAFIQNIEITTTDATIFMTANGNTGDLSDLGLGSQYVNGSA